MKLLDSLFYGFHAYQDILSEIGGRTKSISLGLMRSARPPVISKLCTDLKVPLLLLTDRPERAMNYLTEINFWAGDLQQYYFSEPTSLFYENAKWSEQVRQERLQVLCALSRESIPGSEVKGNSPLIISTVRALMLKTIPKRVFIKHTTLVKKNKSLNLERFITNLSEVGYEYDEVVSQVGRFSKRGGILDIWIPSEEYPVRIEFFGDEVETIRTFDPITQRTLKQVDQVMITPASEAIFSSTDNVHENHSEFLIPEIYSQPVTLMDYLPKSAVILFDDKSYLETMANEVEEQAVVSRTDFISEGNLRTDFPIPYTAWSEIIDILSSYRSIEFASNTSGVNSPLGKAFLPTKRYAGMIKNLMEDINNSNKENAEIIIASRQVGRIEELWKELSNERENRVQPIFLNSLLAEGWEFSKNDDQKIHLVTDSEIFGWEPPVSRKINPVVSPSPEDSFADLKIGDWVVHVDFGIGRFLGLVSRNLDGINKEFLCIEFDNGDEIYVPVYQADRLTRFIGPGENLPSPTRLGTAEWQTNKQKVQEAVRQVARELLELYAKREAAKGFAFSKDGPWQKEMEAGFPYIETQDQKRAIVETKIDMEKQKPMDRLLCGDVGYGKTEVALRAAFKAVQDGKQVAVLVPTTVLAQQHYETFLQRLSPWPVSVEMLSRFRTPKEQDEVIRKLKNGEVDIIIGTHRLLTSDVQFKDLGLVVIDEEQRFGVTHKEHFKKLRTEVDVLTLTATPIPRTLYMALTGVRDISNINTPPAERQPIITHIGPYSPRLVRQAIVRELERGGQVFFVHNRVLSIDSIKVNLEKLIPEAKIGIGHGQMEEKDLAEVMHQFTRGEIDVLLCTSIIESGLDIPNANTLIVDRGDMFGLAQLYQLRGRVGRGGQRAYAYFFRDSRKLPTPEGQERLEVIAENTQLGAGYSIAMRDLEMRGAGDLLGTRQSGYIAAVGFHLYTRMLGQAVRDLKEKGGFQMPQLSVDQLNELYSVVLVELPIPIGIPIEYVSEQIMRLKLYRRLANIQTEQEAEAIREEFLDRFGPIPLELDNLLFYIIVKSRAQMAGLSSINIENDQIVLRYANEGRNDKNRTLPPIKNSRIGKNAYWIPFNKEDNKWKMELLTVLSDISRSLEKYKF